MTTSEVPRDTFGIKNCTFHNDPNKAFRVPRWIDPIAENERRAKHNALTCEMLAAMARRDGMDAENKIRELEGKQLAFDEAAFESLAQECEGLAAKFREVHAYPPEAATLQAQLDAERAKRERIEKVLDQIRTLIRGRYRVSGSDSALMSRLENIVQSFDLASADALQLDEAGKETKEDVELLAKRCAELLAKRCAELQGRLDSLNADYDALRAAHAEKEREHAEECQAKDKRIEELRTLCDTKDQRHHGIAVESAKRQSQLWKKDDRIRELIAANNKLRKALSERKPQDIELVELRATNTELRRAIVRAQKHLSHEKMFRPLSYPGVVYCNELKEATDILADAIASFASDAEGQGKQPIQEVTQ